MHNYRLHYYKAVSFTIQLTNSHEISLIPKQIIIQLISKFFRLEITSINVENS